MSDKIRRSLKYPSGLSCGPLFPAIPSSSEDETGISSSFGLARVATFAIALMDWTARTNVSASESEEEADEVDEDDAILEVNLI